MLKIIDVVWIIMSEAHVSKEIFYQQKKQFTDKLIQATHRRCALMRKVSENKLWLKKYLGNNILKTF